MAAFGLSQVDGPRGRRITGRWLPWLFYAAVAWCVLAKGLIGPAFIFGGCGAVVAREPRLASGCDSLLSPFGILLALAACCPGSC